MAEVPGIAVKTPTRVPGDKIWRIIKWVMGMLLKKDRAGIIA